MQVLLCPSSGIHQVELSPMDWFIFLPDQLATNIHHEFHRILDFWNSLIAILYRVWLGNIFKNNVYEDVIPHMTEFILGQRGLDEGQL